MKKLTALLMAMMILLPNISAFAADSVTYVSATTDSEAYYWQTMDAYSDLVIEDPQNIADSELFGEWDIINELWITEPLLNYEAYSELHLVEEAAKRGNYDIAKTELLSYYRRKFATYDFRFPEYASGSRYETARLLIENMYGGTPIGIVSVEETPSEVSLNVQSYISTTANVFSVQLVALKKDGYKAVFDSKEGGQAPQLLLVVNGRERVYYPVADATVSPEANGNTTYGQEPNLQVEESYSSIGYTKDRVDTYTKRAYLKFDISDLNEGDSVTGAQLILHGRMERSENPTATSYERSVKDVVAFHGGYIEWDETITWNSMIADTVNLDIRSFDGEDTISAAVLTEARHLSALTYAYLGTENEAFAYHQIRHLAKRISDRSGLPAIDVDNTLYNGMALRDMIPQFTAITQSEHMTPEYFTMMLKYYYMMSQWAVNNWDEAAEHNNFGTANAAGLLTAAIAFQEFKVVDEPLSDVGYGNGKSGGWKEVAKHRMLYTAHKDMFADGACIEVSFNYTNFIISIWSVGLTNATAMNVDFSEYVGQQAFDEIEKMLRYTIYGTHPGFGGWQQGHSTAYTTDMTQNYSYFLDYIDDDMYEWAYSRRTTGSMPDRGSVVFDIAKKAVLRSGWNEDAVAAQINADGGRQLSHGQNDDLGLNIYAYGEYLLAQSTHKDYNYNTPVTGWLLSSKKVNAVEINDVTQKGAYGVDQEAFGERILSQADGVAGDMHPENRELNSMYNFLRVETVNYQDHLHLTDDYKMFRDVLFVSPDYFIVTDYIEPQNNQVKVNSYKQYWHMLPEANITQDPVSGNTRTNFASGPNLLIAPVQQAMPLTANIKTGYWAQGSNYTTANYARYDKATNGTTTFNTVLYPMKAGENATISTRNIPLNVNEDVANAFTFDKTDTRQNTTTTTSYYTLFDLSQQANRDFGDYTTDGVTALIQKNSVRDELAILRGGTEIYDKTADRYLVKSNSNISDIGVRWQGDEILLETSKGVVTTDTVANAKTTNLATNRTVYFTEGSGDSTSVTDGDVDTGWTSSYRETIPAPTQFASFYIDMETPTEVSTVNIIDAKDPLADYDDKIARGEVIPYTRDLEEEDKICNYYIYYSNDAKKWEYIGRTDVVSSENGKSSNQLDFAAVNARYFKAVATRGENPTIYEFELFQANDNCVVLDDMTIASDRVINQVIVNGESVAFHQNPNNLYVYFGDTPIIADTTPTPTATPTPTPTQAPQHGTESFGGGGGGYVSATPTPTPTLTPTPIPQYPELQGHWGETEITALVAKGIVKGDGTSLNLKKGVTRAEFATLLCRALSLPEAEYTGLFSDVSQNDWFAADIMAVSQAGLMQGYNGSVNPNDYITREQMAKMLSEAYLIKYPDYVFDSEESILWNDCHEISQWAVEYVKKAYSMGLMKGVSENTFMPREQVPREQAFVAVYRLISQNH